jgi:hypothetical protein
MQNLKPLMPEYLLVIFFFLLGLKCGHSNSIQIPLSTLRDPSSALILILLEHANLLKRLHDLAINAAGGVDVVRGAGAAVLR